MEEDRKTLSEESIELLGDIKVSIEEAVCVIRCIRISAETTYEDISFIRGMGAIEKLLMHVSKHELVELEEQLRGIHS